MITTTLTIVQSVRLIFSRMMKVVTTFRGVHLLVNLGPMDGDGVGAYVSQNVRFKRYFDLERPETLWLEIIISQTVNFLVFRGNKFSQMARVTTPP